MENKSDFIGIVEKTTQKVSDDNLLESLSKTIQEETNIDIEKSKEIVDDIFKTIDLIDEYHQDLKQAKEQGKSRSEWLRGKIGEILQKYADNEKEKFIKEVKESLDKVNRDIGIEIFDKEINLSKPLKSYKYDNLNQKAIIDDFQNQIKNNTILGAVINEDGAFEVDIKHKEIEAVKKYFEAKLDSDYDKNFKKAIAVATDIAKDRDLLPPSMKDKSPEEIAIIVDKGVTSVKVAYKLAKGELNPIDAVEYTINRNTVILNSTIVTTTTKYGGLIGGKIGGFIGSVFGINGTIVGVQIGTIVGKSAGQKVGEFISKGVKKVASVAKSVANKTWKGIKSVASKLNPLKWF